MEEILDLGKKIDFNNLTYHYKSKNVQKIFLSFKDPLISYKSIKEGNITLEKAEEEQKEFKSELNEIFKGSKKSKSKKSAINNSKTLRKY